MLSRKPCKHCGSLYHSKAKCPIAEKQPLRAVYKQNSTDVPLYNKNPLERSYGGHGAYISRSELIRQADALFSTYIRKKYADKYGIVSCVVCKRRFHWKDVDAGHFIPRRFMMTRWDEVNVHPECRDDNRYNSEHLIPYESFMVLTYGAEAVEELRHKSRKIAKFSHSEIQDIIDKYKALCFQE